jgi:hypothetical protein
MLLIKKNKKSIKYYASGANMYLLYLSYVEETYACLFVVSYQNFHDIHWCLTDLQGIQLRWNCAAVAQ